jgi:hypothetical protein
LKIFKKWPPALPSSDHSASKSSWFLKSTYFSSKSSNLHSRLAATPHDDAPSSPPGSSSSRAYHFFYWKFNNIKTNREGSQDIKWLGIPKAFPTINSPVIGRQLHRGCWFSKCTFSFQRTLMSGDPSPRHMSISELSQ